MNPLAPEEEAMPVLEEVREVAPPSLSKQDRDMARAAQHCIAERVAVRKIIVEAFSGLTTPQVVERLEDAQIANARVNTMHEVWEHPQLKARNRWRDVGSPAGPLPAMLPPGSWDSGPRMDPVPALGEHTDAILAELGYASADIAALHQAGAV